MYETISRTARTALLALASAACGVTPAYAQMPIDGGAPPLPADMVPMVSP